MPLEPYRSDFEPAVRQRGADYKRSRSVVIDSLGRDHAYLTAYGSDEYGIEIERTPRSLVCSCECPYFENDGPCKHIWAALLLLEEKRALEPPWPPRLDWTMPEGAFDDGDRPVPFGPRELDDDFDDDYAGPPYARATAFRPRAVDRNHLALAQLEWLLRDRPHEPDVSVAETELRGPDVAIRYVLDLDVPDYEAYESIRVEYSRPKKGKAGGRTKFMPIRGLTPATIGLLPEPIDRELLMPLLVQWDASSASRLKIRSRALPLLLPRLCETGRFLAGKARAEPFGPLTFDDRGPFRIEGLCDRDGDDWLFRGELCRGDERLDSASIAEAIHHAGLVITMDRVCHLVENSTISWLSLLQRREEVRIPVSRSEDLVRLFASQHAALPFRLPPDLGWEERRLEPRPVLSVAPPGRWSADRGVRIDFDYDGVRVEAQSPDNRREIAPRVVLVRDHDAEKRLADEAKTLGVTERWGNLVVDASDAHGTLRRFAAAGWIVEVSGMRQRFVAEPDFEIVSGIDWFDLRGHVTFDDGLVIGIPELLRDASDDGSIRLADGSEVLLDDGLAKMLASAKRLGETAEGGIRFRRNQGALLDALLDAKGGIRVDETFAAIRERIRNFAGIAPEDPPETFEGSLRDYQRTALGWFRFLRDMSFGGCLADDMGLGKTVQVLGLLESRRLDPDRAGRPSIVVAPRSVLYNWIDEARRFAPALRVRDHSSPGRATSAEELTGACDLVLVTYGTLRRDAALLSSIRWDYAVLDESQAIKNSATATAKAAFLLDADHRLALSGTPIENHLGELWSLMRFLNPGVLGRAVDFAKTKRAGNDDEERNIISRAVRPFILRRTKTQVAPELPARTEQTIHCDLEGAQRRLYDELREHYRRSLLGLVEEQGIARSKIHVLEALLRLRQAACHPDLVRRGVTGRCAKLDALLPALQEVVGEGHKALVFSQFTSFLEIVKERLTSAGIEYLYLDGATRNRKAIVDTFQNDDRCKVFLISLKAGGLGLNLTAAEYVYLLDPWWNPAVEAQAIDRAHRIGQTRSVMAYRIVACDTIEEKIVALQNTKRALADAILGEDKSFVANLSTEDLEFLLA